MTIDDDLSSTLPSFHDHDDDLKLIDDIRLIIPDSRAILSGASIQKTPDYSYSNRGQHVRSSSYQNEERPSSWLKRLLSLESTATGSVASQSDVAVTSQLALTLAVDDLESHQSPLGSESWFCDDSDRTISTESNCLSEVVQVSYRSKETEFEETDISNSLRASSPVTTRPCSETVQQPSIPDLPVLPSLNNISERPPPRKRTIVIEPSIRQNKQEFTHDYASDLDQSVLEESPRQRQKSSVRFFPYAQDLEKAAKRRQRETTMAPRKRSNLKGQRRKSQSSNTTTSSSSLSSNDSGDRPWYHRFQRRWLLSIGLVALCISVGIGIAAIWAKGPKNKGGRGAYRAPAPSSRWANFDGIATMSENYTVHQVLDHDPKAFTQGLQYLSDRQVLVESVGMYRESLVRMWHPENGTVIHETLNEDRYFGEGLTAYTTKAGERRFIQLTWKLQTAFIYNEQLELISQFEYETSTNQGWGITFDPEDQVFYVSDGSENIMVWNLDFEEVWRFPVSLTLQRPPGQAPLQVPQLQQLNELEWDPSDKTIVANIWYQDILVKIDPSTGKVVQVYDMTGLYENRAPSADVLNGIAYVEESKQWYVTGKYWPKMYLVEFEE